LENGRTEASTKHIEMMKPIAVLYATREGHTRRVAERVAEELRARGLDVECKNLREDAAAINPNDYSAVVLAASVHQGTHEREMVKFVKKHRDELARLVTALLSVTLSEAGAEMSCTTTEKRACFSADVQKVIDKFFEDTGWRSARVKPVAGALLYSKYNPLVRFAMKRIAKEAGGATDTSRDYEYTDWVGLDRFVDELADELSSSAPRAGRP
jgi:menaquinone-dependent protoporphyrinogen oxidase